jgi:hypothetical protein
MRAALTNDEKRKLIKHAWRHTPVQLRQRLWRETGYGVREPSEELVAAFVAAASTNTIEACAAVMVADAEVVDLHDVAAGLPALVKIKRDLEYRTPEGGRPLANIVLTREQCVELLTFIGASKANTE